MQTHFKHFSQILMTLLGLVLLALALVLNHKHPHNEGIASLPRNSIYQLEQAALSQAQQFYSAVKQSPLKPPKTQTTAAAYTPPATSPTVPTIVAANELCASIDAQDFAVAQQANQDSYNTFQSSPSSNAPSTNSKAYKDYISSLNAAYATYQQAVDASGCTPAQPAPQPQTM